MTRTQLRQQMFYCRFADISQRPKGRLSNTRLFVLEKFNQGRNHFFSIRAVKPQNPRRRPLNLPVLFCNRFQVERKFARTSSR